VFGVVELYIESFFMKNLLIIFLLIANFCFSQVGDSDKETVLAMCNDFSNSYSENNSYANNRMLYIKNVEIKLVNYTTERREIILRKLHEICPLFLEYSTMASKIRARKANKPDAFELWDLYMQSNNDISWKDSEKQRFLEMCNYALSKRENSKKLCKCTIDKISERFSAEYFLNLSNDKQGYFGGQIGYIYCSD